MTKIPWADKTWNPVTGCTQISEGCANCYAKRLSKRFGWPWEVTLHPDRLDQPLHWRKPRVIFPCSMGDLFHEDVPFYFMVKIFQIMERCPQHSFLILTKRPYRVCNFGRVNLRPPLTNVWFGITAENQKVADERIPLLLNVPAAHRFVSVEPMLGPVNLKQIGGLFALNSLGEVDWPVDHHVFIRTGIDWVICGCESSPKRRPADIDWFRDLRDQCIEANVPFFLKQMEIDGKVVEMPELDGVVWDQMPEGLRK